ncbi:phosphatidylglycerophosphatase A [Candidatus Palibaumannia cicadellinicola]|uniref:Phosphatidylglycerophosphatase A n=1 Tax=Candidatus Palibaumannia cicadellinicola TaxID=186490 RepID=A0A0K2BM55_9GAMM|nr:phosphatidylglycerophosphatase A [Candidatus Baumannia cicadellinicola]AKZ66128.1 Phosphatidylglycerophosphatase A [Candidatus Baumannia cicadellinicola]
MTNYAKNRLKLFNPLHLLATGFGSGMFYWMPGTAGSLVAIPLWWILISLFHWSCNVLILIFSIILGIYVCHKTACHIGVHDHSCIVLDELVGMWITLIMLPNNNIIWIIIGFILFRYLDICKPGPIIWCHRKIKGGIGIIIDDVIAGIIAAIIIRMIYSLGSFFR